MPIIEKAATGTTQVVAGWDTPTNAYQFDDAMTYSETNTAEQTYSGFNISLTGVETLDKVFVRLKYTTKVTVVNVGDDATATMSIKVYDGSTWTTRQITKRVFALTTANDESLTDTEGNTSNVDQYVDVSSILNTKAKLANAQVRLLFAVTADAGITVRWSVDAVAILACYSVVAGVMRGGGVAVTRHSQNQKAKKSLEAVRQLLAA